MNSLLIEEFYLSVMDDHKLVLHKPEGKASHTLDSKRVKHLHFRFQPDRPDKTFAE